jgi:hypothetical protein
MKLANLINYKEHFSARIFLTFSALIIIVGSVTTKLSKVPIVLSQ